MAKSKNVSVYLTERAMACIRGDESLSGRINQILDRYKESLELERDAVREEFTDAEWFILLGVWEDALVDKPRAIASRAALSRGIQDAKLREKCEDLNTGDFFVLVESLEKEILERAPATQS